MIRHLKEETRALAHNVNPDLGPVPYILEAVEDLSTLLGVKDEETLRKMLEVLAVLSEKVADWEGEAIEDGFPLGIRDIIAPWLPDNK